MIRLVDIDPEIGTWKLEVAESQKTYVANVATILGRAYIYRNYRSRAFWVYLGEQAVGMGLYYDCPERNNYDFSQLFIDQRFQGRGYGKAAVRLILDEMRKDGKYAKVTLCYVEGNHAARKMYENFGFTEISHDWDEVFMEMPL